jgi:hypothetical protein
MHEDENDAEHSDADGAVVSDNVQPKQQSHIDNKLFKDYYIVSAKKAPAENLFVLLWRYMQ